MLELIKWFIEVEEAAALVYEQASELFHKYPDYSKFLLQLSKDEVGHHNAMCRAEMYLKDIDDYPANVCLDEEMKWDLEAPFIEFRTKLNSGKVTKKELMNFIVILEYSELNQIFLHILNAVKGLTGGVVDMAIYIDDHKKLIEDFIRTHPELGEFSDRINGLPKTTEGRKKILIVDNTEDNLTILKEIFSKKFFVNTARNGEDALHKVAADHYSAIITDVDMPVMDGIKFYKKALEIIPGLSERIVFYTGQVSKDRLLFFHENRLKYLIKPAPISQIRRFVAKIIN